jgi:hypothetical protein
MPFRTINPSTCLQVLLLAVLLLPFSRSAFADENVPKSIFLYREEDKLVASNTVTGQFFELDFRAKERVEDRFVANAVAIVVTSQRFAGIGTFPGGWQSIRRIAGEKFISAEVQDYSALLVTSDRLLSFYGRNGSWSESKR